MDSQLASPTEFGCFANHWPLITIILLQTDWQEWARSCVQAHGTYNIIASGLLQWMHEDALEHLTSRPGWRAAAQQGRFEYVGVCLPGGCSSLDVVTPVWHSLLQLLAMPAGLAELAPPSSVNTTSEHGSS